MPIPPAKTHGRLSRPPIIAAVSARNSSPGPSDCCVMIGRVGPTRIADAPAISPATTHTASDTLATGIPVRYAASRFSAEARLASPIVVRWRNHHSATIIIGATARMSSCAACRWSDPIVSSALNGVGNMARPRFFRGRSASTAKKSWASPIVATSATSRGASASFRIATSSQKAPAPAATASAIKIASQ